MSKGLSKGCLKKEGEGNIANIDEYSRVSYFFFLIKIGKKIALEIENCKFSIILSNSFHENFNSINNFDNFFPF